MYEATNSERRILIKDHNYTPEMITLLDARSDKVRRGIPINIQAAFFVCDYQVTLQKIRKSQKRWWQF